MKRTLIVLIVLAAAIVGAVIGYYWSSYERPVSPLVEDFSIGTVGLRRVDLMPNRGQYRYFLVALGEFPDVDWFDPANKQEDGGTENVLLHEVTGGKGDMVFTHLDVSAQLLFNVIPDGGTGPALAIDMRESFGREDGTAGGVTAMGGEKLPVPSEACGIALWDTADKCKWEGDRMVIFHLRLLDGRRRTLRNIEIVLVRREAE